MYGWLTRAYTLVSIILNLTLKLLSIKVIFCNKVISVVVVLNKQDKNKFEMKTEFC